MFTGVSFEQAIDYWKKGREVIVLDRHSQNESGGYDNFPFEELFRNVELLADVPAVENPDFKQAVADMVRPDQKQEDSSEEKSVTPPPSERPEVSEMLPAGKELRAKAMKLSSSGMKTNEIAAMLGVKYNTVYSWLHPRKNRKSARMKAIEESADRASREEHSAGWNEDRHACKSCCYRAPRGNSGCDYYIITDQERGCDPADCDKYKKGDRVEKSGK